MLKIREKNDDNRIVRGKNKNNKYISDTGTVIIDIDASHNELLNSRTRGDDERR